MEDKISRQAKMRGPVAISRLKEFMAMHPNRFFIDGSWYFKKMQDKIDETSAISILDTGCFVGNETRFIAGLVEKRWGRKFKGRVIGSDISSAHMRVGMSANKKKTIARFVRADCTKLPFKDGSFDIVFSVGLIHNLSSKEQVDDYLLEVFRVLRRGGIFVSFTFSKRDCVAKARNLLGMTEAEIRGALGKTGMKFSIRKVTFKYREMTGCRPRHGFDIYAIKK